MRIIALVIVIFGILILGLLIFYLKEVKVNSLNDIEELEINTKVELEGKVIEERLLFKGTKLLKMNDLEIICECKESFKGNEIRIVGMIEKFEGKKQVRALKVEVIN